MSVESIEKDQGPTVEEKQQDPTGEKCQKPRDGKLVAFASSNSATGAARRTLENHSDWVMAVAFSPDGKLVASCRMERIVKMD
jgi:WD40 repeat protein